MHVILFYLFSLLLVNLYTIEYMVRLSSASGKEMTSSPSPLLIFYYNALWHVGVYLSLVAYSKLPRHIYIFSMFSFFIIFQHDVFYSCKLLSYVAPTLAYLRAKQGVLDAGTSRVGVKVGLPAGLLGHEPVLHRTMGIL